MRAQVSIALATALLVVALTWLWHKTRSVSPEEHAQFDRALRELRSLDRTINQDVLRARYQLVDSYLPVLRSYRRIEELETVIERPLSYLDFETNQRLSKAVSEYRRAVTAKQDRIERFKYRSADLKELLSYLPGAGSGVAQASSDGRDQQLSHDVNHVLQLTLLYNLTSDESYSPVIARELDALAAKGEKLTNSGLRRRVRTLVMNTRRLLAVKPAVDRMLLEIFEQPVTTHEERVASIYSQAYQVAEHGAQRYRFVLYGLTLALFGLVGYGVIRLRLSAAALASANERLEQRVAERTQELATRSEEMRVVLDNVGQALFTVDLDGCVSRERSAMLDRWFAHAAPGTKVWDVLPADETVAAWLKLGWDQLTSGFLPTESVLDQLPRQMRRNGHYFELQYIPVGQGGNVEKLLLVISDITDRIAQTAKDAELQEQGTIFRHILRDRPGFLEFFSECQRLVDATLAGTEIAPTMRALHTLKGNASMFGVTTLASLAGELESMLLEQHQLLDAVDRARLTSCWSSLSDRVRSLTQTSNSPIELTRADLKSLRSAITAGATPEEVLNFLANVEREPAERRLTRISEQAKGLAKRLGKGDLVVVTASNDVRLDAERWAPFWGAFVHMVRNAIDHGIEEASERVAAGKPAAGQLVLSTKKDADQIIVEITDDGRGIDWNAIRTRAVELGLPATSDDELRASLFHGGVTTKQSATEYSGRGTGVSACHDVCVDLGGTLTILSEFGKFTTFRFAIPSDDSVAVAIMESLTPLPNPLGPRFSQRPS